MINKDIDLTVVCSTLMAGSISRQGIGLISAMHDKLKINAVQLGQRNYKDVSKEVLNVLIKPFNGFGKIAFWTYILGINEEIVPMHRDLASKLKISYSMFESDAIPPLWTNILNSYYDMVVVPDECLISIYKNSGVKIPIFVLPLGIFIEDLLKVPFKEKPGDPFTFGMTGEFYSRKGHIKTLHAFGKKFGNNPKFKLKLHGRSGPLLKEVEKEVLSCAYSNVEFISKPFSVSDYNLFMNEIDCYVFPSSGEGFSITPREMLALGRPCILSNNSAHKTICDSSFVIPVASNKKVPALYEVFKNKQIGYFYECDINDLMAAMANTVDNYDKHLAKAKLGRDWVKQYTWNNLSAQYLTLFKPEHIEFGTENKISETTLTINNKKLFELYKTL